MKPEGAFFSGAVLGVAGAYLYKNYESDKDLKGGAAAKKDNLSISELLNFSTTKNIAPDHDIHSSEA